MRDDSESRLPSDLDERIKKLEENQTPTWQKVFAGLATLVGVIVGGLSIYSGIQQSVRAPQVDLVMPTDTQLVQIVGRPEEKPTSPKPPSSYELRMVRIYMQPVFVNTGQSQRLEVVKNIFLYVKRAEAGRCRVFKLDAVGRITNNPQGAGFEFEREGGSSPLIVTQNEAGNQALAFAPNEDLLRAYFTGRGDYFMTLVADTTVRGERLMGTVRVEEVSALDLFRRALWKKKEDEPPRNRLIRYEAAKAEAPNGCPART